MDLNNIFSVIRDKGINAKKVSEDTGISTGNISEWKKGRSFPSGQKLVTLADYFNCSIDYLLGRETPRTHYLCIGWDFQNTKETILIGYDTDIENAILKNDYTNIKNYEMPLGTLYNSLLNLNILIEKYKLLDYTNQLANIIKQGVGRQNAEDIISYLNSIKTTNIACTFIIRKIISSFNWNMKESVDKTFLDKTSVVNLYSKNYINNINGVISSFTDIKSGDNPIKISGMKTIIEKKDNQWLTYYILSDEALSPFMSMYKEIVSGIE